MIFSYTKYNIHCFRAAFLENEPRMGYEHFFYPDEKYELIAEKRFGPNRFMFNFNIENREDLHNYVTRILPSKIFGY